MVMAQGSSVTMVPVTEGERVGGSAGIGPLRVPGKRVSPGEPGGVLPARSVENCVSFD